MTENTPQSNKLPLGACLRNATRVLPDRLIAAPLFLSDGRIATSAQPGMWDCDLRDHLLFPGLVNAHDHLHLNNFPRLPHREPFPNSYAWMEAFQPYMEDPAVRAARAVPTEHRHWHGALKNLLCGVTIVAHHDPWHPIFDTPGFPVRVVRNYGWSHSLGLGLEDSAHSSLRYGPPVRDSFCSTPPSQPWIIHLAEGTDAIAAAELSKLDLLGCLAANTVLVHGVGLTERDIARILACKAGVVWCPGSNLELLGRTLAPRRLARERRLALGSDSRLTASGDLLSELRLAAAQSDLSPPELLRLVTEAGGLLLLLPETGGLEPGQHADLLILRDSGSDPYRALSDLERRDIRAVVYDGKPAIADLEFADWFAACNLATTPIRLDGRPKLCATHLLGSREASALEPGLSIEEAFLPPSPSQGEGAGGEVCP